MPAWGLEAGHREGTSTNRKASPRAALPVRSLSNMLRGAKTMQGSGTEASACMRLSRLGATWRGMRRAHRASREGDLHRTWSDRIDEQKAGKTKDSQVSSFKLTRNRII